MPTTPCPTNDVTHSFISATKSNWHISVYMVYGDREIQIWKKKLQKSLDQNMWMIWINLIWFKKNNVKLMKWKMYSHIAHAVQTSRVFVCVCSEYLISSVWGVHVSARGLISCQQSPELQSNSWLMSFSLGQYYFNMSSNGATQPPWRRPWTNHRARTWTATGRPETQTGMNVLPQHGLFLLLFHTAVIKHRQRPLSVRLWTGPTSVWDSGKNFP